MTGRNLPIRQPALIGNLLPTSSGVIGKFLPI